MTKTHRIKVFYMKPSLERSGTPLGVRGRWHAVGVMARLVRSGTPSGAEEIRREG